MGDVIDECIHGLTAAWCSICKAKATKVDRTNRAAWRGQEDALEESGSDRPAGFVRAKYDGACQKCHKNIIEGDWIAWDVEVDGWVGTCCKNEE